MADPPLERHVVSAFATPVMAYAWPDSEALNRELAALVLAAERSASGMLRSNVGGWHSAAEFLGQDLPPLNLLRDRVQRMTAAMMRAITPAQVAPRTVAYAMDGWANVSRHGHYNSVHNHPDSVWSGTYYVSGGTPRPDGPLNGRLELLDPRGGASMIPLDGTTLGSRYLIAPLPGLMVLFPSWLNHLVHPFHGEGERISIAFNVSTRSA